MHKFPIHVRLECVVFVLSAFIILFSVLFLFFTFVSAFFSYFFFFFFSFLHNLGLHNWNVVTLGYFSLRFKFAHNTPSQTQLKAKSTTWHWFYYRPYKCANGIGLESGKFVFYNFKSSLYIHSIFYCSFQSQTIQTSNFDTRTGGEWNRKTLTTIYHWWLKIWVSNTTIQLMPKKKNLFAGFFLSFIISFAIFLSSVVRWAQSA